MAKKTDIRLRRSNVANAIPGHANLSDGELAMNTMDGALYFKKSNNTIITAHDDTIMHIDSDNSRVGILTTSPDSLLHINDASNSNDHQIMFSYQGTNSHSIGRDHGTGRFEFTSLTNNNGFNFIGSGPNANNNIFAVNTTQLAVNGDNGRVGIGTAGPGSTLHLYNTNPILRIQESDVTNGFADLIYNSGRLRIRSRANAANAGIAFEGDDGTTVTEYARFNLNGFLGIGTTNPGEPLHIKNSDAKIKLEDSDGTNQVGTIFQSGAQLALQSRDNTCLLYTSPSPRD